MLAYSRFMFRFFNFDLLDFIYYFINKNTQFKVKLSANAKVPTKADPGCAGYDVYASEEVVIEPGKRLLVSTGISTEFSKHFYLRVAPRSGMSVKGIDVGAGVVDSSYRGEIKVLLINNSDKPFVVLYGTRIAQLILERCSDTKIVVCSELENTTRGEKGFGSSGN